MEPLSNALPVRGAAPMLRRRSLTAAIHAPFSHGIVRSAVVTGFALILPCGCVDRSRAQVPVHEGTSDDEWAQCLATATRACVLRHAVRIAEAIDDTRSRARALALTAEGQLKASLPTEALATLDRALLLVPSMADKGDSDSALGDIAKTQAKVGKLGVALETVRSIKSEYYRATAIGMVAVATVEANSIAD